MNGQHIHRILQGATYERGDMYYTIPFAVREECGVLVRAATGKPVKMQPVLEGGDLVPRDFTGCEARMQLRVEVTSPFVLEAFSSIGSEPSIAFDGGRIYYPLSAARTAAMKYGKSPAKGEWSSAIGQLEIIHPGGVRVERLATIQWFLDPEGTR